MGALDGVRIKLTRAHRHICDLDEKVRPLLDVDRDNFVCEIDGDATKLVYKIVKVPVMDPAWSAIVGDALYNLRSAYDHLACCLVELDGRKSTRKTQFPIHDSWPTDEDGDPRRPQLRPPIRRRDIRDSIERIQPYEAGPHLVAVNALCNADKHRLLLVMACVLHLDDIWYGLAEGVPTPRLQLARKPLKDGDPVAWFDFKGTEAPADFDPHLALTVKLDEGPLVPLTRTMPVVDLLHGFGAGLEMDLNYTGNFIDLFEEEWFAYGKPDGRLAANDIARQWGGHRFPPIPGGTAAQNP